MPNHVKNIIQFNCTDEQFEKIRQSLNRPGAPLGTVDFNRIDPMPEELNIEAGVRGDTGYQQYRDFKIASDGITDPVELSNLEKQYKCRCRDEVSWKLGKQYYENIQKYNSPHWYDWCIEHWGTKWNAYDPVVHDPKDKTLEFSTAWSAVPCMVIQVSKQNPGVSMHYEFADEDIGRNMGELDFRDGHVTARNFPTTHSKEAYELAARVRGLDLNRDCRLFYSEKDRTYVYVPEHEMKQTRKEKPAPSRSDRGER